MPSNAPGFIATIILVCAILGMMIWMVHERDQLGIRNRQQRLNAKLTAHRISEFASAMTFVASVIRDHHESGKITFPRHAAIQLDEETCELLNCTLVLQCDGKPAYTLAALPGRYQALSTLTVEVLDQDGAIRTSFSVDRLLRDQSRGTISNEVMTRVASLSQLLTVPG